MKNIKQFSFRLLPSALVVAGSLAVSPILAAEVLTGEIQAIGDDSIIFDKQRLPLRTLLPGVDMKKALGGKKSKLAVDVKVRDRDGSLQTFQTIYGIGRIHKARITVEQAEVVAIEIMELIP